MRAQTMAIALWAGLAFAAAAVPQPRISASVESRVVVPLADRPFDRLVDRGSDVAFDFGGAPAQEWLTADAAWLVWDPDWRGVVRSGADIIGFQALRALDANGDFELTGGELGGLSLWRDENSNGLSEPGEVLPANVHGITAISVRGRAMRTAPNGVRFDDGRTRPLYDWIPSGGPT